MDNDFGAMISELHFDPVAYSLGQQRSAMVERHLTGWCAADTTLAAHVHSHHLNPLQLFHTLHTVIESAPQSNGWHPRLCALALDLGLQAHGYKTAVERCRQHGWFDSPQRSHRKRPDFDEVWNQITAFFKDSYGIEDAITWLLDHKLCYNPASARHVVNALLSFVLQTQTNQTMLRWLGHFQQYGVLAWLAVSDYASYADLVLFHRYCVNKRLTLSTEHVASIRRDVVILRRGIEAVHPPLWHQHLLTEPSHSQARAAYRKLVFSRLHQRILVSLAEHAPCSLDAAEVLYESYMRSGFVGLIERTTTVATVALNRQHMQHLLDVLCINLLPQVCEEIARLVYILHHHIHANALEISLTSLLTEMPSTQKRIAWKRSSTKLVTGAETSAPQTRETHLVEYLVTHGSLSRAAARQRIRDLYTYGILGLVPREIWPRVLDSRLYAWVQLIRYGHLPGACLWSDIYTAAGQVCRLYDCVCPSSQVVRTVFNSIAKPRYWHGGKGLMVFKVHQRIPFARTTRPRLHYRWLLLTTTLLCASGKKHAVLIFDDESQLPLGWWVSDEIPTHREVALALYEAIWHPGLLTWPIRGIPQFLVLPQHLLGDSATPLGQAAALLLVKLEPTATVSLRGKRCIIQMIAAIRDWASTSHDLDTPTRIHRRLGEFLALTFTGHRQDAPPQAIRQDGVVMPGGQTAAAGWLLPVSGQATKRGSMVAIDHHHFQLDGDAAALPDNDYAYRAFPLFLPTHEASQNPPMFIEERIGDTVRLHALQPYIG